MQMKRAVSAMLAFVFMLSCTFGGFCVPVAAAPQEGGGANEAQRYFYNQLPEEARGFYDAMVQMDAQGILKTGRGEYSLVENGHVTREQLEGYASGNLTLLSYMGAARDAFYFDHPDI